MNRNFGLSRFLRGLPIAGAAFYLSCSAVSQQIKEPEQKQEIQNPEATKIASAEIAAAVHIMDVLGKVTGLIEQPIQEKSGQASEPISKPSANLLPVNESAAQTFYNPFVFSGKIFQELGIAKFQAGTVQSEFFVEFSSLNSKELISPSARTSLLFWGRKKGVDGHDLQQFSIAVRVQHLSDDLLFPFFSYIQTADSGEPSVKYFLNLVELNKFHTWALGVNPAIDIGEIVGSVAVAKNSDILSLNFKDFGWEMANSHIAVDQGIIKTLQSKSQLTDFDLKITATSGNVVLSVTAKGTDLGSHSEKLSIDIGAKK